MIYSCRVLAALCLLWFPPFRQHFFVTAVTYEGTVSKFVGLASSGSTNGAGTNAYFGYPEEVSISSDGVFALVADTYNHVIRYIVLSTSSVTTLAGVAGSIGSANGIGTNALFNYPRGVSVSNDGAFALVADSDNNQIRHIVLSTSSVTTLAGDPESFDNADGMGTNAHFNAPRGVSISPNGFFALVADTDNYLIRSIDIASATVTTLAGDIYSWGYSSNGEGTNAVFNWPVGLSISPDGLFTLVADTQANQIRHIVISTAIVTTLAGQLALGTTNGIGTNAMFYLPYGVSISSDGLFALVADTYSNTIRHIEISTASVETLAGTGSFGGDDGIGSNASFYYPYSVAVSPDLLYALVADTYNKQIRSITLTTTQVSSLAGVAGSLGSTNGVGTNSRFYYPIGVSLSSDGLFALVTDAYNHLIRHIVVSTSSVTTLAGDVGTFGSTNGIGTNALFYHPPAVSVSSDGVFALVADAFNHLIRHIVISTSLVTTLAGRAGSASSINGVGTNAYFNSPYGVAVSPDGQFALVADTSNQLIRRIDISTSVVATFAGSYVGTVAIFAYPSSICISPDGYSAFVADTDNHVIRRIEMSRGLITTVAGSLATPGSTNGAGTNAFFASPKGLSISPDGLSILVTEADNNMIRLINVSTSNVTTLAGDLRTALGSSDGVGTNSQFDTPRGVSFSSDGSFAFVVDQYNNAIRRISISVQETPIAGRYSFGVLFGDSSILARGNALLLDYFVSDRQGMLASLVTPLTRPFLPSPLL
jgi:DNA-binding beta-propeller fold protein YncE